MFALPFKFWKGGAFFEHTHRLLASGVGLLTTVLAVWLWRKESRRWLRWLGVATFVGVVLQGVLGGLRVVWFKDEIGIFHAALAQMFFVLVSAIALFTSRWWAERRAPSRLEADFQRAEAVLGAPLRRLFLFTTVLIFLQLILGATMRHQHAGLAIPDFPLAHGKLWPDTSAAAVAGYNAARFELSGENPITAFQIWLQLAHRFGATVILGAVAACAWRARSFGTPRTVSARHENGWQRAEAVLGVPLRRLTLFWLGLVLVQAGLGAWTIWSNKAADVATTHVVVGALSLVTGALLTIIAVRFSE